MSSTPLFACAGQAFTPEHVLASADFRGELAPLRNVARERLACFLRAHAEGQPVDDDLVQARSEQFRRDRGLRSAHATHAWMTLRAVTVDEFGDHLERVLWRERYAAVIRETLADYTVTDDDLQAVLWPDAVFTGLADTWIRQLAGRLAVAQSRNGSAQAAIDSGDWAATLPQLERHFEAFGTETLTPSRTDQALRARWEEFFRLTCEVGLFDTEEAAREAALCVQEDGMPFEEVCATAHGDYMKRPVLLNQVPDILRAQALSAAEGTLLPPAEMNGRYALFAILDKAQPSIEDDATRATLTEGLLEEFLTPLIAEHIQWPGKGASA